MFVFALVLFIPLNIITIGSKIMYFSNIVQSICEHVNL
jgi:hypothetical protein